MPDLNKDKRILVAPLNWGLGHAARCIPIIEALIEQNFLPILAGDGASLELLVKEFPFLTYYKLPSYHIEYAKKGINLKYKLLSQAPGILKIVKKERQAIDRIHAKEHLAGIISDNRFGARSKEVTSVYLTHQLKVMSGVTSGLTTYIHQKIIAEFDECWIPDEHNNLMSGKLSKPGSTQTPIKFIGTLSRFSYKEVTKDIDLLAIISGPEPQRSILEAKLKEELQQFSGKIVIIKGIIAEKQEVENIGQIKLVNFMLKEELEATMRRSHLIITRSGYSSIMDLEALRAKAFFIPTPGQYEQEYLAERLQRLGLADFSEQDDFCLQKLKSDLKYTGFTNRTSKKELSNSFLDVFR